MGRQTLTHSPHFGGRGPEALHRGRGICTVCPPTPPLGGAITPSILGEEGDVKGRKKEREKED